MKTKQNKNMNKLRNISENELRQALNCGAEMCQILVKYSHIKDILTTLNSVVTKEMAELIKEASYREDIELDKYFPKS